jgi:purine-binding chemotaxis protein CheW
MISTDTYIIFELEGAAYAVRSEDVQHVDMIEYITPVPNTVSSVDGVVFSRGQVIPALNLRVRFGLPRKAHTQRSRLIFLKVHDRLVALIVDAAREFRRIPPESIRPIQQTLHGVAGNFVRGVASVKDKMVLLLDVGAVLTPEETAAPEGVIPSQTASS